MMALFQWLDELGFQSNRTEAIKVSLGEEGLIGDPHKLDGLRAVLVDDDVHKAVDCLSVDQQGPGVYRVHIELKQESQLAWR